MKIINTIDKQVEFVTVRVGDCFMFDNCLFMRINPIREKGYERDANAFCFVDNNITYVNEACLVTPVVAEITILSKGAE